MTAKEKAKLIKHATIVLDYLKERESRGLLTSKQKFERRKLNRDLKRIKATPTKESK